ncbi:hypothetical protein EV561_1588 [Rhizobium sp. BK376]|nr:hypothetical protein EV561_1588 [Rhizobium sp. BK376]
MVLKYIPNVIAKSVVLCIALAPTIAHSETVSALTLPPATQITKLSCRIWRSAPKTTKENFRLHSEHSASLVAPPMPSARFNA